MHAADLWKVLSTKVSAQLCLWWTSYLWGPPGHWHTLQQKVALLHIAHLSVGDVCPISGWRPNTPSGSLICLDLIIETPLQLKQNYNNKLWQNKNIKIKKTNNNDIQKCYWWCTKFRSQLSSEKHGFLRWWFLCQLCEIDDLLYPSLCVDTLKDRNRLRLGVVPENRTSSNIKTAIMPISSHSTIINIEITDVWQIPFQ